jgi:hypothetical protein
LAALPRAIQLETAGPVMKCFRPTKNPGHHRSSSGFCNLTCLVFFFAWLHAAESCVAHKVYSFYGNTLAFAFKRLFTTGTKFLRQFSDFLEDLMVIFQLTALLNHVLTISTILPLINTSLRLINIQTITSRQ